MKSAISNLNSSTDGMSISRAINASDAALYEIDLSPGVLNAEPDTSVTPLPATLPLFAGGLGFVGYLAKRRKKNATPALAAA